MKTTLLIELPEMANVEFELIVHPEEIQVKGNAIASGDDKYDSKIENRIYARLERGDVWAWCTVEIKATWNGLESSDYLGGCSYRNEKDFVKGGYYEDMKNESFGRLIETIKNLAK